MTVSLRGHDNSNYEQQSSKKYVFRQVQMTGTDGADVVYIVGLFVSYCRGWGRCLQI